VKKIYETQMEQSTERIIPSHIMQNIEGCGRMFVKMMTNKISLFTSATNALMRRGLYQMADDFALAWTRQGCDYMTSSRYFHKMTQDIIDMLITNFQQKTIFVIIDVENVCRAVNNQSDMEVYLRKFYYGEEKSVLFILVSKNSRPTARRAECTVLINCMKNANLDWIDFRLDYKDFLTESDFTITTLPHCFAGTDDVFCGYLRFIISRCDGVEKVMIVSHDMYRREITKYWNNQSDQMECEMGLEGSFGVSMPADIYFDQQNVLNQNDSTQQTNPVGVFVPQFMYHDFQLEIIRTMSHYRVPLVFDVGRRLNNQSDMMELID
jgi:hypothetical protein